MDRVVLVGFLCVAVAAFIGAFIFFIVAARHFIQMLNHFQSGRHNTISNVVPFLVPFMPQLFTEQGNIHRVGFITNLGWSVCCFVSIAVLYALLGIEA